MKLHCENLVKKYGIRTVVKGVSMEINQGEIVGFLGPNGAGKTTSFYMITGQDIFLCNHAFDIRLVAFHHEVDAVDKLPGDLYDRLARRHPLAVVAIRHGQGGVLPYRHP